MRGLRGTLLRLAIVVAILATINALMTTYDPGLAAHLLDAGVAFVLPLVACWVWRRRSWRFTWPVCCVWGMAIGLFQPPKDLWFFWGSAASLIAYLIVRWWNSTRRKRATQALGNKARAIRARLTRTMRERAIPLPT